ncbi:hypothetical protein Leryth_022518 [Lithospermum erythrorhizon]|nr:hypothetical protein Leryth_022518 [Lithospermum erythrorhizon]
MCEFVRKYYRTTLRLHPIPILKYACSCLDKDEQIITLDSPEILAIEKSGDKNVIAKASKQSVSRSKSVTATPCSVPPFMRPLL